MPELKQQRTRWGLEPESVQGNAQYVENATCCSSAIHSLMAVVEVSYINNLNQTGTCKGSHIKWQWCGNIIVTSNSYTTDHLYPHFCIIFFFNFFLAPASVSKELIRSHFPLSLQWQYQLLTIREVWEWKRPSCKTARRCGCLLSPAE